MVCIGGFLGVQVVNVLARRHMQERRTNAVSLAGSAHGHGKERLRNGGVAHIAGRRSLA